VVTRRVQVGWVGIYSRTKKKKSRYRLRLEVPRIRGRVGVSSFIVAFLGNGNLVPGGPAIVDEPGPTELPLAC